MTVAKRLLVAATATSLLALPVAASAAASDTIKKIDIEGLRRVEAEAALKDVDLEVGQQFDPVKATAALQKVWGTGFFRDVRVEREPVEGGWRVIFVVVEKPSIREVKYIGNDDLSEEDIKGVVDVKPFTILDTEQLNRNVAKIRDLYVEKGHYLAQVDYRVEPVKETEHEVVVIFDIVENAKVVVKQISFIGNENIPDDEIKAVLQTREGGELSFLTQSGTYKEEFFETDLFRIQALYYDHGYVSVRVGEPTATISSDRRYIYLSAPIEEGEQYDIGELSFSGDVELRGDDGETIVNEASLRELLTIEPDETFNRTRLFEDVQRLTDAYRDQGYAYANVSPNAKTNPAAKTVDIDMQVERGEIVYIGRIEIVGNTRTRDKVIRREMRIYEGDKYSASLMNASRARIYQLGFFETVNVATSRGDEPHLMNLTVEVKEKSTGTFQIGAGFSSIEKFIATAQIAQNNFLGNGQLLSVSAQLSFGDFARQLATLQFYEPYFLDSRWSLSLNAYLTQRYYREFQRNAKGFSPGFGYPITPDLRVTAGYTLEWVEIESDPLIGPSLFNLNSGNGRNSALNASIIYDTRDNRLFPTKGQYHVLSTEISDRSVGSDEELEHWRNQLVARYYYPLPLLDMVLKMNASFGIVTVPRGDRPVAISERFFPGGIFSVRGFEPRGLGPERSVTGKGDPTSPTTRFTVGGNKEVVFNLELEVPLIDQAGIKGVLFADAGNAYNDNEGFFYIGTPGQAPTAYLMRSNREIELPLGLFYSFGFGFRWFSPIGPLRFEWGIPITKRRPTDRGIIFEFTIGNFF